MSAVTYAMQVKNELARLELGNTCCQKAELTAFIHLNGKLQISDKRVSLIVVTSNPAIARRIFKLIKSAFQLNSELLVQKKIRLRKNNVYLIRISGANRVQKVLADLGLLQEGVLTQKLDASKLKNKCCRRAYLRGAFLAAGSILNPEHSYHLEIYSDYQQHAENIAALIKTFEIKVKIVERKNGYMVYLKDSEQIADFLNVIGAHSALLDFENVRILKDLRNRINRLVNFETANVTKTVQAAVRQAQAIKAIAENIGLESLSPPLRELAYLRLEHPEASLVELGQMLHPPLSKSGVNHRMRRLEKIGKKFL